MFDLLVYQMGITQSKEKDAAQIEQVPINHERFTNKEVVKCEEGEVGIQIKISVPSEKEYNSWLTEFEKIEMREPLMLPHKQKFNKNGFCGSAGVVQIVYENYPFLLSDEIHNRECISAKYFQENQLWYLAYTLLSAAAQFHNKGRKVGDIRPLNVFISEQGSVKVACLYSWPLEKSNYEKSFEKEVTYLSPEEYIELGYGNIETKSKFDTSQTFSIGLTVLDAATLGDSTGLYKNWKQFDYQGLEKRLEELEGQGYSQTLVLMVKNMCDINAQNRVPATELYHWLQPYDSQINNFYAFNPQPLPSKFLPANSIIAPDSSTYSSKPYVSAYNPPFTYVQSNPTPILQTFQPSLEEPQNKTSFAIPNLPYQAPRVQITQSTYMPHVGKFSLQKIDQQLEKSRKLFPS